MSVYQHGDAFDEGHLQVSDLHSVYYAQYGKPDGKPVIFLHGGPGGGTSNKDPRFFDPTVYRVVLMDQRGGGKSTPAAELCENTTQLLVSDIEALRTKLQIAKWHIVFGGSWGSTLSLAYAQTHPASVGALVLRGIFLGEAWEADWTLRGTGAAVMFPDAWDKFIEYLSPEQREDPLAAYHKLLVSDDEETRLRASRHWNRWESSVSYLELPANAFAKDDNDVWNLQHARMETHYFVNDCFLTGDKALMKKENIERIAHIPTYIVQGRYDVVCPPRAAWALHKALPQSKLSWSSRAGHSASEPGTEAKLVEVCDELRSQ